MVETIGFQTENRVSFCSSLKDDTWHNLAGPNAFESWHFDALSDDGREALVITFYDNYVLSPRFFSNSVCDSNVINSGKHRFPAVSFVYSLDGRPILSSVNEFVDGDFLGGTPNGGSLMGSSFRLDTAEYGSRFVVNVNLRTYRGWRIQAELEWVLIDADLLPMSEKSDATWNIVAPRADVSGKIVLIGRSGKARKTIQFRGSGYHDQVTSSNAHYPDLGTRFWGRAHFTDTTVVFDKLGQYQDGSESGKVYLIRNGGIRAIDAVFSQVGERAAFWGVTIPKEILLVAEDRISLRVKPITIFRNGIAEAKTVSEIELELGDGKLRKNVGIAEFVDPVRLKSKFFRWISDSRIGSEDRSPWF